MIEGGFMKISLSWLHQYLSGSVEADAVSKQLTARGIEVEGIEELGLGLSGVVAVQIVSAKPHPDADKLNLCTITDGQETLEIVCGAKNWRVGDLVPFAKVGATLPGGILLTPKTLKGIESRGMLCSERELGLSEEAAGLWILPPDTAIGLDLAVAVRDTVLVLGVTPNRPDCLSHLGVAREVALAFGLELKLPSTKLQLSEDQTEAHCKILLEDPQGCPRYAARILRGVSIKPSPLWLQRRLQAVGIRAISNIVDVTNYVMMELGQPLHAFDLANLAQSTIRVRQATPNEKLKTLDGQERTLSENGKIDLVIADAERAVAIAGVMGGAISEVNDKTQDVLVESAYFHPSWVRRTAKRQRLHTESSHRFERGCNPDGVHFAQDRALSLMQQLSGGVVLTGRIDAYPAHIARKKIRLRSSRIRQVLGVDAPTQDLAKLDLVKLSEDATSTTWEIPNSRPDLEREIDLIEEVVRLYGIDNIPIRIPKMSVNAQPAKELRAPVAEIQQLREAAKLAGVSEAVCYAFCDAKQIGIIPWAEGDVRGHPVHIANPISDDLNVLRTTLLPGLLLSVGRNQKRQRSHIKLFEFGRVFYPKESKEAPQEVLQLGLVLSGETAHWWGKSALDFFEAKGLTETLLSALSLPAPQIKAAILPYAIEGAAANIFVQNIHVGDLCELHPGILEGFEVAGRTFWIELSMPALDKVLRPVAQYHEFSRFPAVTRDIALLAELSLSWHEIEACINAVRSSIVQQVSLFDLYQGQNLPVGHRSLAISLTYQSPAKTLTDEEVSISHEQILSALVERLPVKIR
jgi:phenylalanyl-tRNA synthetase beta chain